MGLLYPFMVNQINKTIILQGKISPTLIYWRLVVKKDVSGLTLMISLLCSLREGLIKLNISLFFRASICASHKS